MTEVREAEQDTPMSVRVCVSNLCVCLPWGIVKQTHHILCQHHHTTHEIKKMTDLSLSLSPTHRHIYTPTRMHFSAVPACLSALEQPVRQATGKIMLFFQLGKSFEMCCIINIWLEDVTLTHSSHIFFSSSACLV